MKNMEDCFEVTKEITEKVKYVCKECKFFTFFPEIAETHNREHITNMFSLRNPYYFYIRSAYCKDLDTYLKINEDQRLISDSKNWVGPGWYIVYEMPDNNEGVKSESFVSFNKFIADFMLLKRNLDVLLDDFMNQLKEKEPKNG